MCSCKCDESGSPGSDTLTPDPRCQARCEYWQWRRVSSLRSPSPGSWGTSPSPRLVPNTGKLLCSPEAWPPLPSTPAPSTGAGTGFWSPWRPGKRILNHVGEIFAPPSPSCAQPVLSPGCSSMLPGPMQGLRRQPRDRTRDHVPHSCPRPHPPPRSATTEVAGADPWALLGAGSAEPTAGVCRPRDSVPSLRCCALEMG